MKKTLAFIAVGYAAVLFSGVASANLIFDRGLPTSNLNNTAGSNRSNVAWADLESSNTPAEYWLPGDDFTLSGSPAYQIDTIRVWTTSSPNSLRLWFGSDTADGGFFSSYTSTTVTYNNDGSTKYQGSTGTLYDIYQVDFTINRQVAAGKYYFFLDGPWTAYRSNGYVNPFLHASNAALSGSTQQGSDDYFQWLHVYSGSLTIESWLSGDGGGTAGWGPGWDKNSDGNVQVYGASVPEPSTVSLLGLGIGLALLSGVGMRRKKMVSRIQRKI